MAVWGASFVATRMALTSFHPFGLVAVRLFAGGLLLGLIVRARGDRVLVTGTDAGRCLFLGAVLGIHLFIQAYGLQYTSAIRTGWIIAFIPGCIALGAHLFLKQPLRPLGWLGLGVAFGGVLLVTGPPLAGFEKARFGDFLQLLSCFTWTIYTLAAVAPVARNGALRVTAFAMGVAAIMMTLPTFWTGVLRDALTISSLLAVVFLGLAASGLAFALWFRALDEQGATRLGSLLYFEPFFTMATAALLLREPVTMDVILGGVIVLVGVWLVGKGSSV